MNYILKNCLLTTIGFLFISAQAQQTKQNYIHQVSITSENDSYHLKREDRYYTNGLFVTYTKAINSKMAKKIFHATVGQSIYTPYSIKEDYQYYLDRPYTGFLYARGGLTHFYKNENALSWNVMGGVIGKAAGGEAMQKIIHQVFGFVRPQGWETTLKTEVGINLQASYYQHLLPPTPQKRYMDIYAVTNASAGTTFSNFSQGLLVRIGLIKTPYNSGWWSGHLSKTPAPSSHKVEFFTYLEPSVTLQVYNATVQGGMFTKNNPYTTQKQPIVFSHKMGVYLAQDRYAAQLGYTYTTKEARTMVVNQTYGTISLGYCF